MPFLAHSSFQKKLKEPQSPNNYNFKNYVAKM